jgi:hypothetical protein
MTRISLALSTLALTAGLAGPTFAALPFGTLSFVERTGTVTADQTIPVMMRLTLDADSPAFNFSSDPLTGFDPEDIPTEGQFYNPDTQQFEIRPFVQVTGAFLNTYYSCQGDFTNVCSPSSNYSFEFNTVGSPGHPSINFLEAFTLNPGESFEYTFGYFVPVAGGATPGVYRWNGTAVTLNFRGLDADGNTGNAFTTWEIGTGGSLDPDFAFERTVTAIPEPGTWALMGLGLFGIAAAARRRRLTD